MTGVVDPENSIDAQRCEICGEPNDCALAAREASGDPSGQGDEEPCWCVAEVFPKTLLDQVNGIRIDPEPRQCICRSCLAKHAQTEAADGPSPAEPPSSGGVSGGESDGA